MLNSKRILVPVDFSRESDCAVEWAVKLAKRQTANDGAIVYLLHVLPESEHPEGTLHEDGWAVDISNREWEDAGRKLAIVRGKIPAPVCSIALRARGDIVNEICLLCEKVNIDLVVMTTHGRRGLSRSMHASVSEKTIRLAPCPVLALHLNEGTEPGTEGPTDFRHILVPVDFSEEGDVGVRWATELAKGQVDASLYLLHTISLTDSANSWGAWNVRYVEGELEYEKREFERERSTIPSDITCRSIGELGGVPRAIRRACEKYPIDLVVMVTRSRRGLARLFHPNTSEKTVRQVSCPVLVLHLNQEAPRHAAVS